MNKLIGILIGLLSSICALQAEMYDTNWRAIKTYNHDDLIIIAMPLGGIGVGMVSFAGRGDLRDWEIIDLGTPGCKSVFISHRGSINLLQRLLIRKKTSYGVMLTRVVEGTFGRTYHLAQMPWTYANEPMVVSLEANNPKISGENTKVKSNTLKSLEVFKEERECDDCEKKNPLDEGEFGYGQFEAMTSNNGLSVFTGFEHIGMSNLMKNNSIPDKYICAKRYTHCNLEKESDRQEYRSDTEVIWVNLKLVFKKCLLNSALKGSYNHGKTMESK